MLHSEKIHTLYMNEYVRGALSITIIQFGGEQFSSAI